MFTNTYKNNTLIDKYSSVNAHHGNRGSHPWQQQETIVLKNVKIQSILKLNYYIYSTTKVLTFWGFSTF